MNRSYKSQLFCLIIFLLYINLNYIFDVLYRYAFSDTSIRIIWIRAIPLLLLLLCYLIMLRHSKKLSVNFVFFMFSLFSLLAVQIHKFLYYYLLIDNLNSIFIYIMYILFITFLMLAFFKNFENSTSIIIFLLFILPISFVIQISITVVTEFAAFQLSSYTNPNRYEFVKYHYLIDKDFSTLPDKLPTDATNIIFDYTDLMNTKSIHLEYNSSTIDNEEHYIEYDISFSQKNK